LLHVLLSIPVPMPTSHLLSLFLNPPPHSTLYTLSLHDALPIFSLPAGLLLNSRNGVMGDGHRNPPLFSSCRALGGLPAARRVHEDRKSKRLNSSHVSSSYDVFCLKKKI